MSEIRREAREGTHDGAKEAANEVLRQAIANLPVGDPALDPAPETSLAELGYVRELAPGTFEIGFHGPYAAWQHENQWAKHPRGGGPKFLENALKAVMPQMPGIVAAQVRARVKAGRR